MVIGTHDREAEEVLAVHNTFWQAYAQRDLERRFSVCAPDVTFFGTGHQSARWASTSTAP